MKLPLILPILIPLVTAAVLVLTGRAGRTVQRFISLIGTAVLFVATLFLLRDVSSHGIQVVQLGNWPAPFGISFVADSFAAIMVVITGFLGLCISIFALADIDAPRERFGFHPLYHVLLMGVSGAFLTGDLFNLFVWFEVLLMASFVLLALGGGRCQIEGAVKYLTLNFIASGIFLTAVGLLYGTAGTLNMADLAVKVGSDQSGAILPSAMLLLVAFSIKAGLFPLFFWLPASYHTPPSTISAIFAGLLTKVGVYALIRVFTLIFTGLPGITHSTLFVLSLLTMVTGVLGAAAQYEFRRVLSFHIISQIGYMTLGLALFTPAALAAAVFYVVHHIIVKTNLFLIAGAVGYLRGTGQLATLGGLYRDHPWLSFWFLIPAMSLAGIPPLSGFFAKFALLKAALDVSSYTAMAIALVVGILTLFSMTKIWAEAFWKAVPEGAPPPQAKSVPTVMLIPIVAIAAVTLAIGFNPELLFQFSHDAAMQLMNRDLYIEAVLGGRAQ